MNLPELLDYGLRDMKCQVSPEQQEKLIAYVELLSKWNKVHNLTAVRDPGEMVRLHLLDSLSVLPYLSGNRLIDVGSGAGLPGIPLAILRPDLLMTSLDSSHKKIAFQRQAKAALGLDNLEVHCGRVEQYQPGEKFDAVISRAFSDLDLFVRLTSHLLVDRGLWLAMKGVHPYEEIAQIKEMNIVVEPLKVPGLDAQRHLVMIKKMA